MTQTIPMQELDPEGGGQLHVSARQSPYEEYVHAAALGSLQQLLTDDPNEMAFLVTTQVMELWFTLIRHEWRRARAALADDDLPLTMIALRRSRETHQALNDALRPIARMTPGEFNGFREAFGVASGFQSVGYRELEFLLGERSTSFLKLHAGDPRELALLRDELAQPSLYDAVLRFLARRGLAVPDRILHRDLSTGYEPDAEVEQLWATVYRGRPTDELLALGEALSDVAETVQAWRTDHLVSVRRAMGSKSGTAGTSGVDYLKRRAERAVFPELWTARAHV